MSRSKQPPAPPAPSPGTLQPVRGSSGRLYGYYDPVSHTLEVKRGSAVERIALPPPNPLPKQGKQ